MQEKFKLEHCKFSVLLTNLLAELKHLRLRAIERVSSDALSRELVRITREFTLLMNVPVNHIPQLTRKFEEVAPVAPASHGALGVRHVVTWRVTGSWAKDSGFRVGSKAFCSSEPVCRNGALVESR